MKTSYELTAFSDIVKLCGNGTVPAEIPAHYWHFCWHMRRKAMGNKAPQVDLNSLFRRSKPIVMGYAV